MKNESREALSLRNVVADYVRAGYAPIPVPAGKKAPKLKGWPELRFRLDDIDDYFGSSTNIGLLLGEPSTGLIDVDLDAREAVVTAAQFLPPTEMVHGRSGKRSSHYWYVSGSAIPPVRFLDIDGASIAGGIATRNRYGNEFYREIRKKRKYYPAYVTRKTKQKMRQMMVDMYKAESNPYVRWAMRLYLQSQIREL